MRSKLHWMKRAAVCLICIPVLSGLFSCSSAGKEQKTKMTVAFFPNITHAQALLGKADGSFQKALGENVTVDWKMFNAGPSEIEALFAGAVDIGYIGPGPAINGYIKSEGDIIIIAGATDGGAILVARKGLNINGVSDLNAKKIAVPQYGNTQDLLLRNLLRENNLSDTTKGGTVEILQVENPDLQTLFEKKEIDAALVPEPWGSLLVEKTGAEVVLDYKEIWRDANYPTAVVVVRKEFLEAHPDLVEKFLKNHINLGEYITENPEKAKEVINEEIGRLTGKNLTKGILDSAFNRITVSIDPNRAALYDMILFSIDAGNIKDVKDKENLVDYTILNKVLEDMDRSGIS